MDERTALDSILSHGEREVAAGLREGLSVEAIAERRHTDPDEVEKSVERIRSKTERALATLAQSPFTDELASDLPPDLRHELHVALGE